MRTTHRAPLLAILSISVTVAAQQAPAPKPQSAAAKPAASTRPKPPTPEYWLQAAETFTADIADEDWRLAPLDKAILQARLCSAWWQSDAVRGRAWCAAAADTVSRKPQDESDEARNTRLVAARTVLQLIAPLDVAAGKQVQDAIELAGRESPPKLRASFDLGVLQHLTRRYAEGRARPPKKPRSETAR